MAGYVIRPLQSVQDERPGRCLKCVSEVLHSLVEAIIDVCRCCLALALMLMDVTYLACKCCKVVYLDRGTSVPYARLFREDGKQPMCL